MNENGHGRCITADPNQEGKYSCYVNQPSNCSDLYNSTTNPEMQLSGEACKDVVNFTPQNDVGFMVVPNIGLHISSPYSS